MGCGMVCLWFVFGSWVLLLVGLTKLNECIAIHMNTGGRGVRGAIRREQHQDGLRGTGESRGRGGRVDLFKGFGGGTPCEMKGLCVRDVHLFSFPRPFALKWRGGGEEKKRRDGPREGRGVWEGDWERERGRGSSVCASVLSGVYNPK